MPTRKIVVLGSTGSIGKSTLDVARSLKDKLSIVALSARRNIQLLASQIEEFKPKAVAVESQDDADWLRSRYQIDVFTGQEGLTKLATLPEADMVVIAVVGASAILPTLAAIEAGKKVALANKECLVAAGCLIRESARKNHVEIIPIDSEHSAIYQCLRGERIGNVKRIILTASGGAFLERSVEEICKAKPMDALRHPTWEMGKKITIDSATLLNKGFEVIEAQWLFGIDAERISVVIERKSVIHSLVEMVDGTLLGILSVPDMRIPIQFALTHPERVDTNLPRLSLEEIGELRFEKPDVDRFPCLSLAYSVAKIGGTAPAALSAADEVVVEAFLEGTIEFGEIYTILKQVVEDHKPEAVNDLETILEADRWARQKARSLIEQREKR